MDCNLTREQLVAQFLDQGILVGPDFSGQDDGFSSFFSDVKRKSTELPLVLNEDLALIFANNVGPVDIDWFAFDASRVSFEKGFDSVLYNSFLHHMDYYLSDDQREILESVFLEEEPLVESEFVEEVAVSSGEDHGRVKIVRSYTSPILKKNVDHFVTHFRNRYEALKKMLLGRSEMSGAVSIVRLAHKQERDPVSIIGTVVEKRITKNGNVIVKLEDPSGMINVLMSKSKEDVFNLGRDLVLDEVVGICGVLGKGIIFANQVLHPDIPVSHELKKAPEEVYAAFISDLHLGASHFFEDGFKNFISWMKGEHGSVRQRALAARVKYLFIVGDIVEGVGIYPGHENDTECKDIVEQYRRVAEYLKQVPPHVQIIACGGNHDAMRIAEPQPPFDEEFAGPLLEVPNLHVVSNPSYVNIHASEDFSGLDVLMYHGFSFPYYANNVPSLLEAGGLDRCDLIMKYLLQRRHLAPTHGSNLYIPDLDSDPLVVDQVPDIFVSGHIHFFRTGVYRNVTLINSGCWMGQTENQAKRGMVPDPCKVTLCNLQTREVRVVNFEEETNE